MAGTCSISKQLKYPQSVVSSLIPQQNLHGCSKPLGGVFADTKYSWTANEAYFSALRTDSGTKISSWTFGAILRDASTRITCVTDVRSTNGRPPLVAVGLDCGPAGGMVCIFHITRSKVLRAILLPDKVTSIDVVDSGCYDSPTVPSYLQAMDGILAVGTAKGVILLVDLCRQLCEEGVGFDAVRDEANACQLLMVPVKKIQSLEAYKEKALKVGHHIAIQLNEDCTPDTHFILKGPDDQIRSHVNKDEVAISALKYCPQLGGLLVGYNFGAWQLWSIALLALEYTSPVYDDLVPVKQFVAQEPADDPRAFCYLWAVYSAEDDGETGFPIAVMYSLSYENKEWLDEYGYLYQGLIGCSIKFQTDLMALSGDDTSFTGGRCISMHNLSKGMNNRLGSSTVESTEDSLSLCVILWKVWMPDMSQVDYFVGIFDLNQWYKEQMPSEPSPGLCHPYMLHLPLSTILRNDPACHIFDVRLIESSVKLFLCPQRLEEHFYPSALSFRCVCSRAEDLVWLEHSGAQQAFLRRLSEAGPLSLLRPGEIYTEVVHLGLMPLFCEASPRASLEQQREAVLSVALEHSMVSWLCSSVRSLANASAAEVGLNASVLLAWATSRCQLLMRCLNDLCAPLFDHSGQRPAANEQKMMSNCARQLRHLGIVLGCMAEASGAPGENLKAVVDQKKTVDMFVTYLEVIQWLLNVGLLPERPEGCYTDEADRLNAPYPVGHLGQFYRRRRNEEHGTRLFIDSLIDLQCGGEALRSQWRDDGGDGAYPPPSLQALLRTYLVNGVDVFDKHTLFIYLFLDLATSYTQPYQKAIVTQLIKFPAVFRISPSVIKVTQAFYQLDHGDFATAMDLFLDPLVNHGDLKTWHHQLIVKALLQQGQHKKALFYIKVRQPPLTSVDDLKMLISLMAGCGSLHEAYHLLRRQSDPAAKQALLEHFFDECLSRGKLRTVLQLPLEADEERIFIHFLEMNKNHFTDNVRVMYYVQRSKFMEAFSVDESLKKAAGAVPRQGLLGQNDLELRDLVLQRVSGTVPPVALSVMNLQRAHGGRWATVAKPAPMSLNVRNTGEVPISKAAMIQASLQKAKETWVVPPTPVKQLDSDSTPFLRTPRAFPNKVKTPVPFARPSIVVTLDPDDEEGVPSKRARLETSNLLSVTPLVKRRPSSGRSSVEAASSAMLDGTPQGILKVKGRSPTPVELPDEEEGATEEMDTSKMSRSSGKLNVRFESKSPSPVENAGPDGEADVATEEADVAAEEADVATEEADVAAEEADAAAEEEATPDRILSAPMEPPRTSSKRKYSESFLKHSESSPKCRRSYKDILRATILHYPTVSTPMKIVIDVPLPESPLLPIEYSPNIQDLSASSSSLETTMQSEASSGWTLATSDHSLASRKNLSKEFRASKLEVEACDSSSSSSVEVVTEELAAKTGKMETFPSESYNTDNPHVNIFDESEELEREGNSSMQLDRMDVDEAVLLGPSLPTLFTNEEESIFGLDRPEEKEEIPEEVPAVADVETNEQKTGSENEQPEKVCVNPDGDDSFQSEDVDVYGDLNTLDALDDLDRNSDVIVLEDSSSVSSNRSAISKRSTDRQSCKSTEYHFTTLESVEEDVVYSSTDTSAADISESIAFKTFMLDTPPPIAKSGVPAVPQEETVEVEMAVEKAESVEQPSVEEASSSDNGENKDVGLKTYILDCPINERRALFELAHVEVGPSSNTDAPFETAPLTEPAPPTENMPPIETAPVEPAAATEATPSVKAKPSKRIDPLIETTPSRRVTRSRSVDLTPTTVPLTPTRHTPKRETPTRRRRASADTPEPSTVDYTQTRRLTRHQRQMMDRLAISEDAIAEQPAEAVEKRPEELQEFGSPVRRSTRLRSTESSATGVTTRSQSTRLSPTSLISGSPESVSSPSRTKKALESLRTPRKRRLRSVESDGTEASVQSEILKLSDEKLVETSSRTLRHKSVSPRLLASNSGEQGPSGRGRRKVLNLGLISEEQDETETAAEKPTESKRKAKTVSPKPGPASKRALRVRSTTKNLEQ